MDPYFMSDGVTIYHGDCRDVIATLPDNSIDAIVTTLRSIQATSTP